MIGGWGLAIARGWPACLPWALYLALIFVASRAVAFGKPFSGVETAMGMSAVAAWIVLAAGLSARLCGALGRRSALAAAAVAILLPAFPLLSTVKLILIGQHLTMADLGFFRRYAALSLDPSIVAALGALIALFFGLFALFRRARSATAPWPRARALSLVLGLVVGLGGVIATGSARARIH